MGRKKKRANVVPPPPAVAVIVAEPEDEPPPALVEPTPPPLTVDQSKKTSSTDDVEVAATLKLPAQRDESPLVAEETSSEETRAREISAEVRRRRALAEAAVKPKPVAAANTRITFYPFAYALAVERLDSHCLHCLADDKQLKACGGGCSHARFCDAECERLARKDHDPECAGYRRHNLQGPAMSVEVRLLGRIAHRYKLIQEGADVSIADFYTQRTSKRKILEIWAHEDAFADSSHYQSQFNDIYTQLADFYDSTALPPRDTIFKLHCRDFVNRHAISDRRYQNEIGKGLYLDLCERVDNRFQYDHSCRPDTIFYNIGFCSVLVALSSRTTNISDPRRSFYSYVDLMGTRTQRQAELRDAWFFACKCARCTDPNDHVLTAIQCQRCSAGVVCVQGELAVRRDQTDVESELLCPRCREPQDAFIFMEANYLMRDIDMLLTRCAQERRDAPGADSLRRAMLEYLRRARALLPSENVYRTRLALAATHWLEPDTEERARLFASVERCMRQCFPPNHPGLAFYLRDVGHFCADAQFYADAIDYLTEALDILERIFIQHDTIEPLRIKIAELQRRSALQSVSSGGLRRLQSPPVASSFETVDSPPPIATLSVADNSPKSAHGSAKERAFHRRAHRAVTPLPPLADDAVRFVSAAELDL